MNKTKTNAKAHKSLREPQRLYSLELLNSSCKHFTVQWTMGRHCAWVSLILHFEVVQFLKFWYKCFMHSVLQLKLCLIHTNFHSIAFLWVPPEINSHDWLLVIFLACLWAYFFFLLKMILFFFFCQRIGIVIAKLNSAHNSHMFCVPSLWIPHIIVNISHICHNH